MPFFWRGFGFWPWNMDTSKLDSTQSVGSIWNPSSQAHRIAFSGRLNLWREFDRRLARNTPAIQVNLAAQGVQQVNSIG